MPFNLRSRRSISVPFFSRNQHYSIFERLECNLDTVLAAVCSTIDLQIVFCRVYLLAFAFLIYTTARMAPAYNNSLGLADPGKLFEVQGKTVVITGGARGLGLHFGQCLARFGANIAAIDIARQPSDAFLALSRQGGNHRYYQADVTDYDGLKSTIDQIARDFGSVDGWY